MKEFMNKKSRNVLMYLLAIVYLAFIPACATAPNSKTINNQVQMVFKEGSDLIKDGKVEEGVKMVMIAGQIHSDDPKIKEVLDTLPADKKESLKVSPMMGFNKAQMRVKIEPTIVEKVLWYFPDRIKDVIDIFSFDINVGPQLGAGGWVTRYVQAVAYSGATVGVGYNQKTTIGLKAESSGDLAIGPVGLTGVAGGTIGLAGMSSTARGIVLHEPQHPLYQEYRDFWSIGQKSGFILLGYEFEFHPLELWDFLAGIVLIDPLNDDFASTTGLKYNSAQKDMMESLMKSMRESGTKGLDQYRKDYPIL